MKKFLRVVSKRAYLIGAGFLGLGIGRMIDGDFSFPIALCLVVVGLTISALSFWHNSKHGWY